MRGLRLRGCMPGLGGVQPDPLVLAAGRIGGSAAGRGRRVPRTGAEEDHRSGLGRAGAADPELDAGRTLLDEALAEARRHKLVAPLPRPERRRAEIHGSIPDMWGTQILRAVRPAWGPAVSSSDSPTASYLVIVSCKSFRPCRLRNAFRYSRSAGALRLHLGHRRGRVR